MSVTFTRPASRIEDPERGLVLRPLDVFDARLLADGIRESVAELRRFMPWSHHEQTEATQFERLKGVNADYWAGREYGMGLFTEGAFLGCFRLHRRTLNPRGLELGYWVRSGAAGRGLATHASRMLVAYAFSRLGCDRVQCAHNVKNDASRRVIEKVGFRLEGELRNFEGAPTAAMLEAGYTDVNLTRMYGLTPDDLPDLDWYPDVARRLVIYGADREKVL
jgi:RimJ/RimL family protein N-acetyltransferase